MHSISETGHDNVDLYNPESELQTSEPFANKTTVSHMHMLWNDVICFHPCYTESDFLSQIHSCLIKIHSIQH